MEENCGGNRSRKLIELTLFITVACFPSVLFQMSIFFLIRKISQKWVSITYDPFYVIIFSQTSQTSLQTFPPSVRGIFGPMVCKYQIFLLLNYTIFLAREEKIRISGIALKAHQHCVMLEWQKWTDSFHKRTCLLHRAFFANPPLPHVETHVWISLFLLALKVSFKGVEKHPMISRMLNWLFLCISLMSFYVP